MTNDFILTAERLIASVTGHYRPNIQLSLFSVKNMMKRIELLSKS